MKDKEIRKLRMDLGRFLHSYYIQFGEEKYEAFLEKIAPSMVKEYGEPFQKDSLRIMEAEFVTFNTKIDDRTKDKKDSSK